MRVEKGGVEARQGPAADPNLVVAGATEAFIAVAAGHMRPEEAVEAGSIRVEGSREDGGHDTLVRCLSMLEPVTTGSG